MAHDADDLQLRRDEAALARRAADGDGSAFAELYDRYERRIYAFCHRLVGSEHDAADATQEAFVKVLDRLPQLRDRDLHFAAYLFTAARNTSYDVIGKRTRADAVDEIPESGARPVYGDAGDRLDLDPERAAMLGAVQAQVQLAHARLPDRQREVLALRELQELSYDEIGEIMGMKRNAVAQLISRARIKLRSELEVGAVAAVRPTTSAEERIAALIAARMDGELSNAQDEVWLAAQLHENPRARVMEESLLEAGASYRSIAWFVPLAWLREATIAKAADRVGADWSQYAQGPADGGTRAGVGATPTASAPSEPSNSDAGMRSRATRRRGLYAGTGIGVLFLLVLAAQLLPEERADRPVSAAASVTATATTTTTTPKTTKNAKNAKPKAAPASSTPALAVGSPKTEASQTAPVPQRVATPTRTPQRPRERPSESRSGIADEGGDGAGRQGPGSAPLPDQPAVPTPPPPAAEPPPSTPPPVTTPPATTPPCRPAATTGQCP